MSDYVGFRIGPVEERPAYRSEYYCGGCGHPVSDHDSYCPGCGGAFREQDATERVCVNEAGMWNEKKKRHHYRFVCSECGYSESWEDARRAICLLATDTRFCRVCGSKVAGKGGSHA